MTQQLPQRRLGDRSVSAIGLGAMPMSVREVNDEAERARLWKLAVAAYPPYADYQARTTRRIPVVAIAG